LSGASELDGFDNLSAPERGMVTKVVHLFRLGLPLEGLQSMLGENYGGLKSLVEKCLLTAMTRTDALAVYRALPLARALPIATDALERAEEFMQSRPLDTAVLEAEEAAISAAMNPPGKWGRRGSMSCSASRRGSMSLGAAGAAMLGRRPGSRRPSAVMFAAAVDKALGGDGASPPGASVGGSRRQSISELMRPSVLRRTSVKEGNLEPPPVVNRRPSAFPNPSPQSARANIIPEEESP